MADLGWFQVILMSVAAGMTVFFLVTFVSIVALLFYKATTHHPVDFALTYKHFGFPAGLVVGLASLCALGYQWVRRVFTRGRE